MANTNSTQYAKIANKRTSGAHAPLETLEQSGKLRLARGTCTVATGANAINDTFDILELPTNCQILSVKLIWTTALGAGSARLTLNRAAYTSVAPDGTESAEAESAFVSAHNITGTNTIYECILATNYGQVINNATQPVKLTGKITGATLTVGTTFNVEVQYVVE